MERGIGIIAAVLNVFRKIQSVPNIKGIGREQECRGTCRNVIIQGMMWAANGSQKK